MSKFKQVLSMLLACCLLVSFLPMSALAVSDSGNNDSAGTAQSLTLGDTISGQIAPEKDVDFYQFVLTESGRVSLDITSYMQWYCMIVYDTSGERLWYTEQNEYNSTVGFRKDAYTVDLESGKYFLKVTGYKYASDSYGDATGTYSIQTAFASANANEVEPNDNAGEAGVVSLGSTIRGLIGANDRFDFYQFTIPTSGRITLDITSHMQWYCMTVYDTSGERLWYTEQNEYNSTVGFRKDAYTIDLESGKYYLKVTGYKYASDSYGDATGTYSIQTAFASANANETEPNNSAEDANIVSPGSTIRGLIGSNDRYDFYRFTMVDGEELTINITSYMQWYCMIIYDTSGNRLWYTEQNEYNATTGFREDTHTVDLPNGTYYLKVTGYKYASDSYGDATGTYSITLGEEEGTVAVTGVSVSPTSLSLEVGESKYLSAVISPADATNQSLTWTSSNRDVATVKSSGVVTAVKAGTAVITVTTEDGGFTAKSTVTVKEKDADTGNQFRDVPANAYYADAVAWAVENDVTSGTSTTSFSPEITCTRGQAVTFLWRAAGSPEPTSKSNPFKDVSSGQYYYKAVLWAVENDVTSGTSSTTFSPNKTCTRAQIVAFQWRAAGRPGVSGGSFSDVPSGSYYSTAVAWAVKNGITSGTGNGKFSPDSPCTRAQIVTFLYRAEN